MTGGHGAFVGREADGPDQVRAAVREQRRDGAEVIKFIATGGVLTPGAVPGIQELSDQDIDDGLKALRDPRLVIKAGEIVHARAS